MKSHWKSSLIVWATIGIAAIEIFLQSVAAGELDEFTIPAKVVQGLGFVVILYRRLMTANPPLTDTAAKKLSDKVD